MIFDIQIVRDTFTFAFLYKKNRRYQKKPCTFPITIPLINYETFTIPRIGIKRKYEDQTATGIRESHHNTMIN